MLFLKLINLKIKYVKIDKYFGLFYELFNSRYKLLR